MISGGGTFRHGNTSFGCYYIENLSYEGPAVMAGLLLFPKYNSAYSFRFMAIKKE